MAILLLQGKYVLQLRDDKPDIASPNLWAAFGGEIEAGESPEQAVAREIEEELAIRPNFRFLWRVESYSEFIGGIMASWVFEASVDDIWHQHRLDEGQAADAFAYADLPRERIAPRALMLIERFEAERRA